MNWNKQIRGQYLYYTLPKEFTIGALLDQTKAVNDDLKDCELDIALDLRELRELDASGSRFIVNLGFSLEKQGRKVVYIGGQEKILAALSEATSVVRFENVADFELEFHEMSPTFTQSLLKLASGGVGFRTLNLICPLCGDHHVKGFILDYSKYELAWNDNEVTAFWEPKTPDVEEVDFPTYQVAVCTTCYFAAARPDFFTIAFPEGEVPSRLSAEEIGNLKMATSARKQIVNQFRESDGRNFFDPPREKDSAYLSWLLHESCQKQMHSDRKQINAFELVVSNLYMCKFTEDEQLINDHLHTALAWLNSLISHAKMYSNNRLVIGYTYQISVLLGLGKIEAAKVAWVEFHQKFAANEIYHFWVKRAALLMQDYLGEVE